MEIFLLYMFTRLDTLIGVSHLVIALSIICLLFLGMCYMFATDTATDDGWKKPWAYWRNVFIILFTLGMIGKVVIPTKQDVAIILAGWGILEVARSETAGRLASKSVAIIEQTLDGFLKTPPEKAKQ